MKKILRVYNKGFTPTPIISLFQRVFANVYKKSSQFFHTPRISQSFSVKQKIPQYDWCRGFTLIELLIVIAIIAILASVIIPNVSTARDKGTTAAQVSQMKTVVTEALQIWDANSGDMSNVCLNGSTVIVDLIDIVKKASNLNTVTHKTITGVATSQVGRCHSLASGWAAEIPLKSGMYQCIDSTGANEQNATPQLTALTTDIDC